MIAADRHLPFSSREHWLVFSQGQVVGCHCGFEADQQNDCGYGDSVVNHIVRVVAEQIAEAIEAQDPTEAALAGMHAWADAAAVARSFGVQS